MRLKFSLAFFLCIVPLKAADWPNWRGPDFNGISAETDWDPDRIENILWKVEVGTGFAGVAVAGGRVYTLGHDGRKSGGQETVYCLDVKSGKKIWSDSYPARLLPHLHEGGPSARTAN
jgi:outer membrane protein assembly factor BamB